MMTRNFFPRIDTYEAQPDGQPSIPRFFISAVRDFRLICVAMIVPSPVIQRPTERQKTPRVEEMWDG